MDANDVYAIIELQRIVLTTGCALRALEIMQEDINMIER